jgi:Tfp pilus assembly protein PilP
MVKIAGGTNFKNVAYIILLVIVACAAGNKNKLNHWLVVEVAGC